MNPARSRPAIPKGYGVEQTESGMLEWTRVAESLEGAEIYWLSTVGAAGGPHLVPLHGTALDHEVVLSGDESSRWSRNLATDPRIHIGVEHEGLQVMVRGRAALQTPSGERFERLNGSLHDKYGFAFDAPIPMWIVDPGSVLAFDPAEFATSPTQFTFGDAA